MYKASPRERSMGRRGHSPRSREPTRDRFRDRKSREHMVALVNLDPWLNEALIEPSKDLRPLPL